MLIISPGSISFSLTMHLFPSVSFSIYFFFSSSLFFYLKKKKPNPTTCTRGCSQNSSPLLNIQNSYKCYIFLVLQELIQLQDRGKPEQSRKWSAKFCAMLSPSPYLSRTLEGSYRFLSLKDQCNCPYTKGDKSLF